MSASRLASKGFLAGTLVHTKEGLTPIERLIVGDWVLSKHSSGCGENAYKRVTNALKSENVDIGLLRYFSESRVEHLFVCGAHPIYIDEAGWREAAGACHPLKLVAFDGSSIGAWEWRTLWGTTTEGIAIAFGHQTDCGTEIYFRKGLAGVLSETGDEGMSNGCLWSDTVYDIEVEECHTYYVGELGVWVGDDKLTVERPNVR